MTGEGGGRGPHEGATGGPHEERVRKAFDALHEEVGGRLDDDARNRVEALREAAAQKDGEAAREHLTGVKERHGWLYEEMVKHPDLALLIDELALWGF